MDLTTILGLIAGIGFLVGAFVMDGGHVQSLFGLTALMIVFGGTIAAMLVSTPMEYLKEIPKIIKIAFTNKSRDPLDVIGELVSLATVARREGILALEEKIETYEDNFFKNGVRLVVDGVDPDLVRSIMETELSFIEDRHAKGSGIFDQAGGFAPTMGIIGTVMGLVHVLSNLEDASRLGPSIAVAFLATLYGIASANLLWLPIANKLKVRSKQEVLVRELMIEGILSIQAGENPNILEQKLKVFLAPTNRERKEGSAAREVGEADAKTA